MNNKAKILVTGGAGFIGSALVRYLIQETQHTVLNLDALTYAGNLSSLRDIENHNRYQFVQADIANFKAIEKAVFNWQPDAIMHLAAESHVDRSIDGPAAFVQTNVVGTCNLLQVANDYRKTLAKQKKEDFRFLHISTDEVYGSLGKEGLFHEDTPYSPRSPYSASKAASDHFVQAWWHTYNLPVLMTNCSNNYGPFHFPEKLIPLVLLNALDEKTLPVYGKGDNVRDWLFVEDHAKALYRVLSAGTPGEKYNVGGNSERTNLEVVETICDLLDQKHPRASGRPYRDLITFVEDRPGHDQRYAIDASKIRNQLQWEPTHSFTSGMNATVDWYLQNDWWWRPIREQKYAGQRLGGKA